MKTKYTEIKLWKEHELIVTLVYWVNDFNFSEFLGPVCLNSAGCGNFSLHISYILQVIWITLRESVCIWSFSGPYFPTFELNVERYSAFLHIQSECRKIQTRKTPNTNTFYVVFFWLNFHTIIKGSVETFLYPYA